MYVIVEIAGQQFKAEGAFVRPRVVRHGHRAEDRSLFLRARVDRALAARGVAAERQQRSPKPCQSPGRGKKVPGSVAYTIKMRIFAP